MQPKILVGCPTSELYEFCLDEYVNSVNNLAYTNYNVLLVDNSQSKDYIKKIISRGINAIKSEYYESAVKRIVESRNMLRKYCLEGGYDYLMSLEQDVIPPKDVIERLLKHDKRIVSGIYYMPIKIAESVIKFKPLLYDFPTEEQWQEALKDPEMSNEIKKRGVTNKDDMRRQFTAEEVKEKKILEVKACGLGCLLIHKDVLKKVEFRHKENTKCFDDIYFCMDARKEGFKIYADTSVKCQHLFLKKPWHWSELKF